MNIKQLQILDAVVRLGSYRKAAAQLRCSQSTITFQLKKLEDSLGCFLF
ncbi:MAG TPA: LysR family transcriptional regulator, partial [Sutterellaceae bacterium]|nr:LysR family transcriptional regulator [Sutterellaceae bacterium]